MAGPMDRNEEKDKGERWQGVVRGRVEKRGVGGLEEGREE